MLLPTSYNNELFLTGLLEIFQNNNALLDQIQKCLEAYLESKCVIFPRYLSFNLHVYHKNDCYLKCEKNSVVGKNWC